MKSSVINGYKLLLSKKIINSSINEIRQVLKSGNLATGKYAYWSKSSIYWFEKFIESKF